MCEGNIPNRITVCLRGKLELLDKNGINFWHEINNQSINHRMGKSFYCFFTPIHILLSLTYRAEKIKKRNIFYGPKEFKILSINVLTNPIHCCFPFYLILIRMWWNVLDPRFLEQHLIEGIISLSLHSISDDSDSCWSDCLLQIMLNFHANIWENHQVKGIQREFPRQWDHEIEFQFKRKMRIDSK